MVDVKSASLALINTAPNKEAGPTLLFSKLDGIKVKTDMRVDSLSAAVSVKGFDVDDPFTKNTKFPKTISRVPGTGILSITC